VTSSIGIDVAAMHSALFHHRHINASPGKHLPLGRMVTAATPHVGARGLADDSLEKPLKDWFNAHTAGTRCPPQLKIGEADNWRGFEMRILGTTELTPLV
jgi:hypothetical protein